jgi:hypothetical protein
MNVRTIVTVISLSALVNPWPLVAQSMRSGTTIDVEAIRAILLNGLEQHKQMDIEFTQAIPDSALRWKPGQCQLRRMGRHSRYASHLRRHRRLSQ